MTYSSKVVLDSLLTSAKFSPINLPLQHGIYCLWDHLDRPLYIGETHSPSQNYRSRIMKHISGSVDTGHYFSYWYNHGPLFTFHNPTNKDKLRACDNYELRIKQTPDNQEMVKRVKNKLIRNQCKVSIFPIEREGRLDEEFKKHLKDIEGKVQKAADIKAELAVNVITFPRKDILICANGCPLTLNAFKVQEELYLEYTS
ncbi:hypothetical protein [Photobacterium phosphoreum]|uniref:hypothetical protein n=1 Tax=Photobacterium phosphoreum TaxID=659 RepID=UPI000D164B35|nr:hypothetical protein [Photobacterium phosphoreum]PTB32028.1 hypothetical protein DAT36_14020 [Photobacterium phosphoreum]